jgi:hypothetical protein
MRRKGFRDSLVVLGLCVAAGVAARVHGQEAELVDQEVEVVEDVALRDATTRVFRKLRRSAAVDAATGTETSVAGERAFIQKGSGLCYPDPHGQWTPAAPRWTASGASFRVAEAAYELASGLVAGGGVEFFVEGSTLRATPQSIVFTSADAEAPGCRFDGAANAAVGGEDARKLRFPEAYGRDVDLEYEVSTAGFEQNLLLRSLPPLPGGFEAGSTRVVVRTRVNLPELTASGLSVAVNGEPSDLDATGSTDWVQIGQISFDGPEGPLFWFADSLVLRADGASTIAEKRLRFDSAGGEWLLEERLPFEFFVPSGAFPVLWDFTVRSGAITVAEVWKSGETIFVLNDITVQAPGVLTIEPDCVVKINGSREIVVSTGKVIAKGAPYRPITFTSADDLDRGEHLCLPTP